MARIDPAWLNTQYNNRELVPEHPRLLARWAEASALSRANGDCQLDLCYGAGPFESLDLFAAPHPGGPVLVFIHGGYWRSLDKSDFSFIAPAFNAAGAMVVVPNYALCPAVSIEQITWQMVHALQWVWHHAAEQGGDPQRIVVAGHSAGAHLAAMMLSCRWKQVADDLPAQLVSGAMAISGLYDLEPLRHMAFLQGDLQLSPASVKRLSPAFFPRPKGRLYAAVGAAESQEFLRQNQLIRDVWGPTAVPVCETIAQRNHFDVLDSLVDPSGRLHELTLRLLGLR
jgi:arylformamidase